MSTTPPVASDADLPPVGELENIDLRGTLRSTVLGIIALIAGLFLAGLWLHDELVAAGGWFVTHFGSGGVLLAFGVLDCIFLPIPHDTFLFLGLSGGLPLWKVCLAGSVGSVTGGVGGYHLARAVANRPHFRQLLATRGRRAYLIVRKYGTWGVAIGALSPLPYTFCAWAAGALAMDFRRFFVVSLLRIPRVVFYAWLIEKSFAAAGASA